MNERSAREHETPPGVTVALGVFRIETREHAAFIGSWVRRIDTIDVPTPASISNSPTTTRLGRACDMAVVVLMLLAILVLPAVLEELILSVM